MSACSGHARAALDAPNRGQPQVRMNAPSRTDVIEGRGKVEHPFRSKIPNLRLRFTAAIIQHRRDSATGPLLASFVGTDVYSAGSHARAKGPIGCS